MFQELLQLLRRHSLIRQALDECYAMADLCRVMVPASMESLRRRDDASIDLDIRSLDKRLNSFERDVRRKVMTHLLVAGKGDIASGLALVSIVIDLERIGDYSKNIHDLAVGHPRRLVAGVLEAELVVVETLVAEHFGRSMDAFKAGDSEAALGLMAEYKQDIALQLREMEGKLLRGEVDLSAPDAVAVALYLRFLKRISSHSRNLVSSLANPFPRIGYESKPDKG